MTIAIAGVAEPKHGPMPDTTPMGLHAGLAQAALDDAGLLASEIDAVLTLSPRADPYLIHATALCEFLRITPELALTIEGGGAAPAVMVDLARGMIATHRARSVLIVNADMPLTGVGRKTYTQALADGGPVHPDLERPFGPTVPSLFGIVAAAYLHETGASDADLAAVALQDRALAARHPNAHMTKPMDLAAYRASAPIADPLRMFDCAPVSDGGGALVVTSAARAGALRRPPVHVLGAGFASTHLHLSAAPSLTRFGAGLALERALGEAGLARDAIDLACIYDCFTIAMLVNAEDMGLAERGGAGASFRSGAFAPGGRLPVNTHGGLLSHGYPGRAAGIGNVIEAVLQLRGAAGARQLQRAEVAVAHGMGGVFATHGVLVLGRG